MIHPETDENRGGSGELERQMEQFNDVSSPDRGGLVLLVVTQRSSESV